MARKVIVVEEDDGSEAILGIILGGICLILIGIPIAVIFGGWIMLGMAAIMVPIVGIPALLVIGGLSVRTVKNKKDKIPVNNNIAWPWFVYWLELSIKSMLPGFLAALAFCGILYALDAFEVFGPKAYMIEGCPYMLAGTGCTTLPALLETLKRRPKKPKKISKTAERSLNYELQETYCPACGSEMMYGASGCQVCGYTTAGGIGDQQIYQETYCDLCGCVVDSVTGVCSGCGETPNKTQPMNTSAQKSKAIACALALFGGVAGLHDFYLGDKKNGIIKVVLFCLSGVSEFMAIAVGIWALVDFLKLLFGNRHTDANGIELRK